MPFWRKARAGFGPPAGLGGPSLLDTPACQHELDRIAARLQATDPAPRSIVFAGVDGGEGCTTIALNMAHIFAAREGKRTLLVDAHLRRPVLHRILSLSLEGGISDWDGTSEPKYQQADVARALLVFTAGSTHEAIPMAQWRGSLLKLDERARNTFEVLVYDAPPIRPYPDTLTLARAADGVVLIVESNETKVASLSEARAQLDDVGARVLGVVMNRKGRYVPSWLR